MAKLQKKNRPPAVISSSSENKPERPGLFGRRKKSTAGSASQPLSTAWQDTAHTFPQDQPPPYSRSSATPVTASYITPQTPSPVADEFAVFSAPDFSDPFVKSQPSEAITEHKVPVRVRRSEPIFPTEPCNVVDPALAADYNHPLARLPVEIWAHIATFVSAADAAHLAMSSKLARYKLGAAPWLAINLLENKKHRIEVLLPMDQQLPGHIFCFLCGFYHLRSQRGNEKLTQNYIQNPIFSCPNARDMALPKTRLAHNRDMPFYLVQLAMRSHVYGPEYGLELPALARSWKCRESEWSHRTRFHVYKGHLVARVISTCFAKAEMTPSEERLLLFSRHDYMPYFSCCSHWSNGELIPLAKCALSHIPKRGESIMTQLKDRPKVSLSKRKTDFMPRQCEHCKSLRRCPDCPSEYLTEIKLLEDPKDPVNRFKHALSVTRWMDLGDGTSLDSPEWAACNGQGTFDSFAAITNATLCSHFEAAVSQHAPTSRALSLGNNTWRHGDVY